MEQERAGGGAERGGGQPRFGVTCSLTQKSPGRQAGRPCDAEELRRVGGTGLRVQALTTATGKAPDKLPAIPTGSGLPSSRLQRRGEVGRAQQQTTLQPCSCLSCYSLKGSSVPAQTPGCHCLDCSTLHRLIWHIPPIPILRGRWQSLHRLRWQT